MSETANEPNPGLLKSLLQLIFSVGIPLALGFYLYAHFTGNPFRSMLGQNLLENATRAGVSDKASMDAFVNAGGLENESTWQGFQVRKYEAVYHPDGKLGMINLTLIKKWPGSDLASLDNLQKAMEPQCGSSWKRTNDSNVAILQTQGSPTGFTCSAMDQGRDVVLVSIANIAPASAGEK